MRILLESIGCRLNMAELDDMASHFMQAGHRIVGPGDMADLVVFNSCAVTHAASRKSRQVIRRLRRSNPVATIVATGCHSDLSPNEVKNIGVELVVSNALKHRLPSLLDEAGIITPGETCPENPEVSKAWPHDRRRTRAFVKVQDGCDNRCTFCIVTVARGPARSRSVQEILCEINSLVDAGYQEVVLTGVHLRSFGHDNYDQSGLMHRVHGHTSKH